MPSPAEAPSDDALRPRDRASGVAAAGLRSGNSPRWSSGRSARPRHSASAHRQARSPPPCARASRHRARPGPSAANGPIGKPKATSAASTSCGSAPSRSSRSASRERAAQHAVADETVADADQHRHLAELAREPPARSPAPRRAVFVGAHHFDQPHDVGRAEEMQCRARPRGRVVACGDGVDVLVRGVAGEERARLGDAVELAEYRLLQIHFLEHRLDHQIGLAGIRRARASPVISATRLFDFRRAEAAARLALDS